MELHEVLIDDVGGEAWVRFRFIAPSIARSAGRVEFADLEADFAHLCRWVALPYIADYGLQAKVAVITLLDRPVAFGTADPDATQFIEAFQIGGGTCEWDEF